MLTVLPFEVDGWLRQAQALQLAGRPDEAETLYRRVLELRPNDPDALLLLGAMLGCHGADADALPLLERAVALRPDHPESHAALGDVLAALGRTPEAIDQYHRALALRYDQPIVHFNLGNVMQALGRSEEAERSYRRTAQIAPTFTAAHYNLGLLLRTRGELEEAAHCFRQAAEADPDRVEAYQRLGETLYALDRPAEAAGCYRRALTLQPNAAILHLSLGVLLQAAGQRAEAAACYHETLRIDPGCAEAHNNLGALQLEADELDAALRSLQAALRLRPDYADAYNNLGNLLAERGAHREGVAAYRQAVALAPDFADAHLNLGNALLRLGDYREGWMEYEWRMRSSLQRLHGRRTPDGPRWDGAPLPAGTLLVYVEQGLGDALQFLRFLPLARARAARLLLACPPELHRLLVGCEGHDGLIAWEGRTELQADYEAQISLMSLPGLFGIELRTLPQANAGIGHQASGVGRQAAGIGSWAPGVGETHLSSFYGERERDGAPTPDARCPMPLKVGLVWAGNPRHHNDRRRSIPLRCFAPLSDVSGVALYGLQKGEAADQALDADYPISLLSDQFHDFCDTAEALLELDLVISVDTSVAHLAGVMGRPVWTLLPYLPDWRWGLDRDDTPWYPSMRLFRQPRPGDWPAVIERIAAELKCLTPPQHQ